MYYIFCVFCSVLAYIPKRVASCIDVGQNAASLFGQRLTPTNTSCVATNAFLSATKAGEQGMLDIVCVVPWHQASQRFEQMEAAWAVQK